jgi:hypothetical protein
LGRCDHHPDTDKTAVSAFGSHGSEKKYVLSKNLSFSFWLLPTVLRASVKKAFGVDLIKTIKFPKPIGTRT